MGEGGEQWHGCRARARQAPDGRREDRPVRAGQQRVYVVAGVVGQALLGLEFVDQQPGVEELSLPVACGGAGTRDDRGEDAPASFGLKRRQVAIECDLDIGAQSCGVALHDKGPVGGDGEPVEQVAGVGRRMVRALHLRGPGADDDARHLAEAPQQVGHSVRITRLVESVGDDPSPTPPGRQALDEPICSGRAGVRGDRHLGRLGDLRDDLGRGEPAEMNDDVGMHAGLDLGDRVVVEQPGLDEHGADLRSGAQQ